MLVSIQGALLLGSSRCPGHLGTRGTSGPEVCAGDFGLEIPAPPSLPWEAEGRLETQLVSPSWGAMDMLPTRRPGWGCVAEKPWQMRWHPGPRGRGPWGFTSIVFLVQQQEQAGPRDPPQYTACLSYHCLERTVWKLAVHRETQ